MFQWSESARKTSCRTVVHQSVEGGPGCIGSLVGTDYRRYCQRFWKFSRNLSHILRLEIEPDLKTLQRRCWQIPEIQGHANTSTRKSYTESSSCKPPSYLFHELFVVLLDRRQMVLNAFQVFVHPLLRHFFPDCSQNFSGQCLQLQPEICQVNFFCPQPTIKNVAFQIWLTF